MQISNGVMFWSPADVQFIDCKDTSGASLDVLFSDQEQKLLSLQDLFRKLVVHTVLFSQLPVADLHQLLFKIFEFGHDCLGLRPSGCLPSKPWAWWKVMFFTTSSGSFRWDWIKCLNVVSGSSSAFSGIPENPTLSLMLWPWSSITVSLIFIYFLSGHSLGEGFHWLSVGSIFVSECFHQLLTELHWLMQLLIIFMQDFQEGQLETFVYRLQNIHHATGLWWGRPWGILGVTIFCLVFL